MYQRDQYGDHEHVHHGPATDQPHQAEQAHALHSIGDGAPLPKKMETFDDFAQMRPLGLNAAVNVPLLKDDLCYATFNVFGTRGRFR